MTTRDEIVVTQFREGLRCVAVRVGKEGEEAAYMAQFLLPSAKSDREYYEFGCETPPQLGVTYRMVFTPVDADKPGDE